MRDFLQRGATILDPFCGSGTTLVEARLQGINSFGIDINGLACLLSKVKSTPLNGNQVESFQFTVNHIAQASFAWGMGQSVQVPLPTIEGLEHWFQPNVANELAWLKSVIDEVADLDVKDLLKIIFASIIVQVSNQESDTRYAAINKNIQDNFTLKLFVNKCPEYIKKVVEFSERVSGFEAQVQVANADARDLSFLKDEQFDAIITSPPYANTYDYYLYHKFRKRWLGLDVKYAQYNEIGSRREFSSLKKDPAVWTADLKKCFLEMVRILKASGLAFIVMGDSVIKKTLLKMDEVIVGLAEEVGFKVCDIVSASLSEHSRMFNPSFTQKGKKEHLILLQKHHD